MAKVTLYLDTRTTVKGRCQVKLQISHRGTNTLMGTGVLITPEQWQPATKEAEAYIKRTARNYTFFNNSLRDMVALVEEEFVRMTVAGTLYSFKDATELKHHLENEVFSTSKDTFSSFLHNYIQKIKKDSTRDTFINTEIKINRFTDGRALRFEDITPRWLSDFEESMSNLAVNTRSIYIRNIRTVFNKAINTDVVRQDLYPFRKFRIKQAPTAKRSLTVDELRQLIQFKGEPYHQRYIDYFSLIFFLIGINAADLFSLTGIVNGRVDYVRCKTGRPYSIKVEPEALAIIERYRGDKKLLKFAEVYENHKSWLHRVNKALREIGPVDIVAGKDGKMHKKVKHGIFPKLSTYWARHTWATMAAELDIPKETIAAALGHGGRTVTDIYINFDQKKVDAANRRVIDYVLYDKK